MEEWRDIPEFSDYQASSLGRVRSKDKTIVRSDGVVIKRKGKLLAFTTINRGYYSTKVTNGVKTMRVTVHLLVANAFLGHQRNGTHELVVDHINENKKDNRPENLRIVSNRENCGRSKKSVSGATGVRQVGKNFFARIQFEGKELSLGGYRSLEDASNAYKKAFEEISNGNFKHKKY